MKFKKIIIGIIIILVIVVCAFSYIAANTHATKIEVLSNSTLKNGDFVEIVLKDEYRNLIPNQNIEVKILDDSGWANKFNLTTDKNGEAQILLQGFDNGNYTIHSNFNGTMFLKDSKSISGLVIDDGYSI